MLPQSEMQDRFAIELPKNPITVQQARQLGLSWKSLQTIPWTRLSRGQYVASAIANDTRIILRAVEQRLPCDHAFSGPTAAWLWGIDLPPCEPIEVTVGRNVPIRARAGIRLRRAALPQSDIVMRRGFRVTSPLRTVRDLGSRRDLSESVVAIDMALRARLVEVSEIRSYVERNPGTRGINALRRAVRYSDPRAESPMETRLRMQLVKAKLPIPSIQADLHDPSGNFIGRADMYYPEYRLVIEYDGENHKDRLAPDARRQNALINAGYHVLRFTAADVRKPGAVVAQVTQARAMLPKVSP